MALELYGLTQKDVDWLRRLRREHEGGQLFNSPPRPTDLGDRNYARVWFRNDNAGTVPAYGVMRVTGGTTVASRPVLTTDQPNTTFQRLYLVNGPTAITTGKYGWATWLWHSDHVLYDSGDGTPAYGESWGPKASQWTLAKWRYGFTITGANTTSPTRATAMQHVVNHFLCKSNELIDADGDTGAVSVYDGNQADTSMDVSACVNRTGIDFANNTWGKANWLGGKWYVEPWECP